MEKKQKRRRDGVWQDEDSKIWRYRFMFQGKRYFGADPTWKNKGEAKAARDRRRIAVREGREDKTEADANFRSFAEDVFLPYVETNMSKATYRTYKSNAGRLIRAFGSLELSAVSVFAVEKFKREELARITNRGKTGSVAAINGLLQTLGSIFTVAEQLGKIERADRPKITMLKGENRRLRYLSTDEEKALLAAAAATPYLEDVIVVGLATGLRRDELFSLRAEDVDLRLNLLTVLDGKGGKTRSVPLDPESEAYRILEQLARRRRGAYLLTTPRSKGKKTRGVDDSLSTAAAAANLEGVTLHTLRHTFCTRLAAAGVDVRTIQELAGHADIQTTMRYVHLVESNKHAAIRRLRDFSENCHEITTGNVVEIGRRRA